MKNTQIVTLAFAASSVFGKDEVFKVIYWPALQGINIHFDEHAQSMNFFLKNCHRNTPPVQRDYSTVIGKSRPCIATLPA